jgi:hypothetical protein
MVDDAPAAPEGQCLAGGGRATWKRATPKRATPKPKKPVDRQLLLQRQRRKEERALSAAVTVPFVRSFPTSYGKVMLLNASGQVGCWSVGRQSADEFIARHALFGADAPIFHGRQAKLAVFFPLGEECFVKHVVALTGVRRSGVTLRRVLHAIEDAAVYAAKYHLLDTVGAYSSAEVNRALQRVVVCWLMCRRVGAYHVYVRDSGPGLVVS